MIYESMSKYDAEFSSAQITTPSNARQWKWHGGEKIAASNYVAANSIELILDSQDIIGYTATLGGIPGHAFTTSSRARDLS